MAGALQISGAASVAGLHPLHHEIALPGRYSEFRSRAGLYERLYSGDPEINAQRWFRSAITKECEPMDAVKDPTTSLHDRYHRCQSPLCPL